MDQQIPQSLCFSYTPSYHRLEPNAVKKILVVQGSPRKTGVSKTEMVTAAFIQGCEEAGATAEIVNLRDKKIKQCQGCFTCWTKTPGECCFKDDAWEVIQQAQAADLVVYASPLYHFSVIALMKKFIERTLPIVSPYLIEREDGQTTHPGREGFKPIQHVAIIGVCGFPEVSHFGAFSANFHYLSNAGGPDHGMKIVAELYRPASEIIGNPFYAAENNRMLDEVKKAGKDLVSKGYVEAETVDAIADVKLDKQEMYEAANKSWDYCINEKISMPDLQKRLAEM